MSFKNPPEVSSKQADPTSEKPVTPPSTYVIQVAKDQIYRYPPPENARRYQSYSRQKPKHRCCCRCLCWTLGLAALLVVLLAVAAGVFYLVVRPELPKYSVNSIAIRGFNLTSSSSISPEFDVTVRAQNPNDKIGIDYEKGSSVMVYYTDVHLCDGVLPAFYQPSNNVTVFETALKGSKVVLSSAVHSALVAELKRKTVPFRLNLRAPVKVKVGGVKTWTITVKVKCDVTVDNLTAESKIVSKDCDISVKLW
ncbi:NDR1/HIN1-like protein 13 [Cornus florida]|uniref:NDR1/HIN1-like protein 13 n=1 Tax=Cornus florida TaxID=4283 RepID=UPI00289AD89F|nr:NDR1/HIN1-like protein 13 [Cornus florida]